MPKFRWIAVLTLASLIALPCDVGWSRGFGGGGRGGGGGGGGFNRGGGGGFGGGAGGGGFNRGGGGGGMNRGGGGGGFNRGGEGGGFNRGGEGGFNRGGENFGGGGGFNRGGEGGFNRGGEGFGGQAGGFNRGGEGAGGFNRGGEGGFGQAGGAAPNRSQLNNFLGMPSDEGMRPGNGNWTGAQGAVAGAAAANRNDPRFSGAQGAVAGAAYANRNPGVGYGAGFGAYAPGARYGAAAAVRSGYNNYGLYGSGWYGNHPGAWAAAGWAAGAAWNAASWNTAGAWCGYANTYPTYYDYGNNVTYQDGNVYMNGQDNGSAADYYNQASTLASTGAEADAPSDGEWLPLGVFAASKQGETGSHITIQLAINKAGILRGNETDTDADTTQPIQGSLDKQSQKVAFTIGDDTSRVVETGLYNLTKDESPALVHLGAEKTEQWLLVRIKKPSKAAKE